MLLGLKLGMAQRLIAQDPTAATTMHAELRADLDRTLSELRDLAHGIYPAVLENEGRSGALREAVHRTAIPTRLECDRLGRYAPQIEAAVYFCCLEALQNAGKYAGDGAQAIVDIREQAGALRLTISDDGSGYDSNTAPKGRGLRNMSDRLGALGGSLQGDAGVGSPP